MKKIFYIVLVSSFLSQIGIRANETFSVEIEALTLVMEKLYKDFNENKR